MLERFVCRLDCCVVFLFMGCSSGCFFLRGDYEFVGVLFFFFMVGCLVVIVNLWDVIDGDIDCFSWFLLYKWFGIFNDVDFVILERKV